MTAADLTRRMTTSAVVVRHAEGLRDWFLRETGWMLEVERGGARLFKRPADLHQRGARPRRLRPPPLCAAVSCLRRAGAGRPADHPAPARRAPAEPCRRAGAGRAWLHIHACEPDTSGASWWRSAAPCSSSACCSAWPATRRPSCSRRRRARRRALRRPAPRAGRHAGRRARPLHLGRRRTPPSTLDDTAAGAGRGARRRQRGGPPHGGAPPSGAAPARRPGGLYRQRWRRRRAPTSSTSAARWQARLCEATGLDAEQRAEGLALVDETGALTDVAMPAEGTEAHATLAGRRFPGARLAASETDRPRRSQRWR